VVLASAAVATAQQPAGPEWATLAERLRELPAERLEGTPQVMVLDWRTGAPLPEALVVALAAGDVPTKFLPGPVAPARLLARALEVGRRLAVAADGQVVAPAGALVVAVHGDRCAAGDEGVLAPEPHTPWPIELRGADGSLRPNHAFFGRRSDAHGRLAWPVWPGQRAGSRLLWIGADNLPGLGMLPPGGLVRDGHDVSASPTVALLPAMATLVVRGEHRGVASDLGHTGVYRQAPFLRGGGGWAQRALGGEQVEIDDAPVGEVLCVRSSEAVIDVPPLTAGEGRLVVVPRPTPVPIVRYRLVDAGGRVLRGVSSHEGGPVLAGDAGTLRVPCDEPRVFVRMFDVAGEEWSCAPFPPPQATTVVLPQLLLAVALPAAGVGAAGGGAPGGVVEVVVDIAFADVEVTGLPTASPWSFGLRIVGAGGDGRDARVGELVGGRGRMVVPLRADLLVQRFDAQGRSWWVEGSLEPLPGFVGAFVVPAAGVGGAATQVRFVAPVGLVEELARREAQR